MALLKAPLLRSTHFLMDFLTLVGEREEEGEARAGLLIWLEPVVPCFLDAAAGEAAVVVFEKSEEINPLKTCTALEQAEWE